MNMIQVTSEAVVRRGCCVSIFADNRRPYVVGIGRTLREGSTAEQAFVVTMNEREHLGATASKHRGFDLELPMYRPGSYPEIPAALACNDQFRQSDVLIFSTPSYHGSLSGMIKNAIDYVEGMRAGPIPYLECNLVGEHLQRRRLVEQCCSSCGNAPHQSCSSRLADAPWCRKKNGVR